MSTGKAAIVTAFFCAGWIVETNYADAAVGPHLVNHHSNAQGSVTSRANVPINPSNLVALSGTSPNGIYRRTNSSATIGGPATSHARSTTAIDGANINRKR